MNKNINWFPRLMVLCVTLMSLANPAVKALAKFIRSSWKTRRPRNRSGKTDRSTLAIKRRISDGKSLMSEPSNTLLVLDVHLAGPIELGPILHQRPHWAGSLDLLFPYLAAVFTKRLHQIKTSMAEI